MGKCKCWEIIKNERMLSDFEKGAIFARTGQIIERIPCTKQICNGTRERDECSCGGDKRRCNFYRKERGADR